MEYRGPGFRMPDFLGDIGESSVSIVVIENIGVAGKPARPAHHRNAFPLAEARIAQAEGLLPDRA